MSGRGLDGLRVCARCLDTRRIAAERVCRRTCVRLGVLATASRVRVVAYPACIMRVIACIDTRKVIACKNSSTQDVAQRACVHFGPIVAQRRLLPLFLHRVMSSAHRNASLMKDRKSSW